MLRDELWMKVNNNGSLYGGQSGICPERWKFWKLLFSEVMGEVDEEVANMAQQAIDEMERIEEAA